MLRSVDVASVSISRTMRCWVTGRPKCFPRVSAALMPAVTRSLMSEDSSSAMAPMIVNIARTHRAVGIHLILDADEAHAEMVEFFQRRQQMARAARKAIEFPDQHAVDLAVSGRRHQGAEVRATLPTARHSDIAVILNDIETSLRGVSTKTVIL